MPGVEQDTNVRLNGAIRAFIERRPMFAAITPAEPALVPELCRGGYDAIIFDLEHGPYDIRALRYSLQHMLDRGTIMDRGDLSPPVTPLARIPAEGPEMSRWHAKQALDAGVYGVVWPRTSTVEQAQNAVAACRYPPSTTSRHPTPAGVRGFGPSFAARYWGLEPAEYCERADVWPLAPHGEVLVVIMCEDREGVRNLDTILDSVPGIGAVLLGPADLSMDLGHRGRPHPQVEQLLDSALATCLKHHIPCGLPGVGADQVAARLDQGYAWIIPAPTPSTHHPAIEAGRRWRATDPPTGNTPTGARKPGRGTDPPRPVPADRRHAEPTQREAHQP
jgi:4-hydroxy-2-oxoheptanedioate aldolase